MDGEANAREQRACRRLPNDSGEVGEARHAGAALPIARLDPLKGEEAAEHLVAVAAGERRRRRRRAARREGSVLERRRPPHPFFLDTALCLGLRLDQPTHGRQSERAAPLLGEDGGDGRTEQPIQGDAPQHRTLLDVELPAIHRPHRPYHRRRVRRRHVRRRHRRRRLLAADEFCGGGLAEIVTSERQVDELLQQQRRRR